VDQSRQRVTALHWNRLVAPTKQVPPKLVPTVETLGPGTLKPAHSLHQVGFRSFEGQVIVIAHQDPGIERPTRLPDKLLQGLLKTFTVLIVDDDVLPPSPRAMTW
jgi:hypothetical protein